jgi:hypothetical protein
MSAKAGMSGAGAVSAATLRLKLQRGGYDHAEN